MERQSALLAGQVAAKGTSTAEKRKEFWEKKCKMVTNNHLEKKNKTVIKTGEHPQDLRETRSQVRM